MLDPRCGPANREGGFTLIELLIVMVIMAVVLLGAGTAMISFTNATNRTDATVTEEQQASTAVSQMVADIRSAHSLSVPSGATASNEVLLVENQPSGSTTQIEWIYIPASGSTPGMLTRYTQNSGGTLVQSGTRLSGVVNSSSQPLLSYYDEGGGPNSESNTIANCTTRVTIDLVVSAAKSSGGSVSNYEVTQDAALTDQIGLLVQPGSVQC